jgi:S1-C subfamily serine protease
MEAQAAVSGALQAASDALADLVERTARSVVAVRSRSRIPATGLIWQNDVAVTSSQAVTRDEGIVVLSPSGSVLPAALAGRDPGTDIAVLRVSGLEAAPFEPGDANALRSGHIVFAVARSGTHASVDYGLIASVGPAWRTWRGAEIERLVRLDGGLRPGFSGAPLVDAGGKVVAMCTSALSRGAGIGIPLSTVSRVVTELLSGGRVRRGFLGVGLQPVQVPAAWIAELKLAGSTGLLATTVEAAGPAESAGLVVGDILLTVGGRPSLRLEDVLGVLSATPAGQPLQVEFIRGGRRLEATLTLGERPHRDRCA